MAITVVFDVPGMTAAQYDKVIADLEREGEGRPAARRAHIASQKPDGWYVVDVWESPEDLDRFAGKLMPILQANGVKPPQPQVLPTHSVVQ